jgi:hypothetical protein
MLGAMSLACETLEVALSAPAAVSAVSWSGWLAALGVRPGLPRRRSASAAAGLLLAGSLAALLPALAHGALRWVGLEAGGLGDGVQWALAAGLIAWASPRGRRRAPPGLSLLPLVLVAWQGLGAALAALVIAGSGAVEPGQPRRGLLIAGLAGLTACTLIDANSLQIWMALGRWTPFGGDAASLLVDGADLLAGLLGWSAVLAWVTRPPTGQRAQMGEGAVERRLA